jgi:AraC-like protein
MLQSGNSVITFSTDAFAPSDRFSMWRELFGRTVLNVDIEQNSSSPFRAWATIRKLPEVGLMTAYSSGVTYRRAPQRVNSDDVVFSFGAVEGAYARQRGRETWAKQGDALLMLAAEGTMVARNNDGYLNCVRVPRAALAARVRNVEDRYCRRIPGNLPAVQLLSRYVALLEGAETPQLQQSAATHVLDLIGLALGATRDASHAAGKRGLRAARLEVIKDDITRNLGDEALSVQTLSRRQRLAAAAAAAVRGGGRHLYRIPDRAAPRAGACAGQRSGAQGVDAHRDRIRRRFRRSVLFQPHLPPPLWGLAFGGTRAGIACALRRPGVAVIFGIL